MSKMSKEERALAARIDRDIAKAEQREIGEALPKPDKWAAVEKAMREGKVVSIEPLNQKNWR